MFGLHIRSLVDNGKRNNLLTTAQKKGLTIQDGGTNAIINFFDDKAVDWWWKNAAKKVTDLGAKFFKTDVGSALNYNNPNIEQKAAHNLFPIAYAKAPYENFAKLNGQRGFDHTREGYAGIQRYPFIWAGDWGSEWQWFEPIIRGGINIGLSGVGYWSHCMGGFEQYSAYDTTSICAGCRWECSRLCPSSSVWIILVIMRHGLMARKHRKYSSSTTRCVMHSCLTSTPAPGICTRPAVR